MVRHPLKANELVRRCPRCGGQQFFDAAPEAKEKPRSGAELIALERHRQVTRHGYDAANDDRYRDELVRASIAYSLAALGSRDAAATWWPWDPAGFKPSVDPSGNLVRAGALIAAEIDRVERAEKRRCGEGD